MEKQVIVTPGTDPATMTISPGVRAGNLLFVSGSAGHKNGKVVGPDIESQARQAMENLGEVLKAAGTSWDKVVKVGCFLTHSVRDFAGWNKVFKEYFPTNPPARTTVEAFIAMEGALIEVDLVAIVD